MQEMLYKEIIVHSGKSKYRFTIKTKGRVVFLTSPFVALNASKEYSKIGIPILGLLFGNLTPSPILPQFAYPCIIAAPYQGALNPLFAFISGRIALIFQNRSLLQAFLVTLPLGMANLLRLGKKKNEFFCFALDFS